MSKVGKHIPSHGQQIALGNVVLTPSGLTALLVPNGISGNSARWLDIYDFDISSSDTAAQQVTLSDGVTSVVYFVASPSPVDSNCCVPARFGYGLPLYVSAGTITTAKAISVVVRGVLSST